MGRPHELYTPRINIGIFEVGSRYLSTLVAKLIRHIYQSAPYKNQKWPIVCLKCWSPNRLSSNLERILHRLLLLLVDVLLSRGRSGSIRWLAVNDLRMQKTQPTLYVSAYVSHWCFEVTIYYILFCPFYSLSVNFWFGILVYWIWLYLRLGFQFNN